MSALLAAGADGKFNFSDRDHAVTDADINDVYDIVIPRTGVYTISAEGPIEYQSASATGHLIVEIRSDGIVKSTQTIPAFTETGVKSSFNLARSGVDLEEGALLTVYCYNLSSVGVVFGGGTASHLDATYDAEASLLL